MILGQYGIEIEIDAQGMDDATIEDLIDLIDDKIGPDLDGIRSDIERVLDGEDIIFQVRYIG